MEDNLSSKPTFLCIGAQKSGTTLLYEQLKKIDDLYLPRVKEVHFFDRPSSYIKGVQWYKDTFFQNPKNLKVLGEITPSYIYLKDIPKKIYESLGSDTKFIVILRNPVDRAYSHYIMRYKRDEEKYSFNDALVLEQSRTDSTIENKRKYSYAHRGLYASQLSEYFKYFNKNNFHFILFEDFIKNQDFHIKEICDFLSVKKKIEIKNIVVHNSKLSFIEKLKFAKINQINIYNIFTSKGYPSMNKKTKNLLQEYYREDITKLASIINKDLSSWLQ